jgi:hypothetical protein
MTARRRLTAAVSAGFALVLLTACEKPAPIVTVVSGDESVWSEANTFCFEGQSFQNADCASRATEVTELEVRPGQLVGVDVSKEVVERGWLIELGEGEQAQQSPIFEDDHYFSFTAPNAGPDGLPLTIRTIDESGQVQTGEWRFLLVPQQ